MKSLLAASAPPSLVRSGALPSASASSRMEDGRLAGLCLKHLNPALDSYMAITQGQRWVSGEAFAHHVDRFGLSFLTEEGKEQIFSLTAPFAHKLLSVFTGLCYSEAQLAALGMDVIGFDKNQDPRRWLVDVRSGPSMSDIRDLSDRPLFLSFPDRGPAEEPFATKVVNEYREAGGKLLFVISDASEEQHAFGSTKCFFQAASRGEQVLSLALMAWSGIESLVACRVGSPEFKPTLKAYRFKQ